MRRLMAISILFGGLAALGATAVQQIVITQAGRDLVAGTDAAAQRSTLGLDTIATQAANSVSITGGSISGITDLSVADGGTGVSTLTGIVKGNGTSAFSAASAGTDYLAPSGSAASLTAFPAKLSYGQLSFWMNTVSPSDNDNRYFGGVFASNTVPAVSQYYLTRDCLIKNARVYMRTNGTLGSIESSTLYLRKNNATDYTIIPSMANNVAQQNYNSASDLDISLAAGDYIELKWSCPTWNTTNPTNVYMSVVVGVEWQ